MRHGSKLFCIGIAATLQLSGADPRIGSWKLISAQSSVNPPRKLSIARQGKGVHVVVSGSAHIDFTANWDGRDSSVPDGSVHGVAAFNQIMVRRIDQHQAEIQEKKDGLPVALARQSVGRRHGIDGRHNSERPPGPDYSVGKDRRRKRPRQSFRWRLDAGLEQDRLRQGMTLRFEPHGKDAVHFVGDYSYTASPDGKDYLLQGSPNDTVAITIVDAHTVESVYKRGDEIVKRDRWVVSADGFHITVTDAGASGDGEFLKETLTYERRK